MGDSVRERLLTGVIRAGKERLEGFEREDVATGGEGKGECLWYWESE